MFRNSEKHKKTAIPVVIQGDRGVHYTSKKYQELTKDMVCSYSGKGSPWDNASIELYHLLLKREWLNRFKIMNYYYYYYAYQLVFEYLEGFYNTVRGNVKKFV